MHTFLFSQQKWNIQFINEIDNGEIFIYADNNEEMPMSAQFKFTLNNLSSTYLKDEIIVIPPRTKKFLMVNCRIKTTLP